MKISVFFLFLISLYNCQAKIEKIVYETSMGIPIEKSVAKSYLDVYKKVFLKEDEVQKVEYRLGNDSTKLLMLLDYREDTDMAKVVKEYPPAAARIPSCGFFFLKPIVLFFIFIITLRWRKRPACDRFCNGYERDARTSVLLPCT